MATEEQTTYNTYRSLYSGAAIRAGQRLTIPGRTVSKLSFHISKFGSPTGDVTFTIRKVSDSSIIASKVLCDAADLVSGWNEVTLDTPVFINEEVRIGVEFSGGNAVNRVQYYYQNSDVKADEYAFRYVSAYIDSTGWDGTYIYTYGAGEVKTGSATLSGEGSLSASASLIRSASATLAGTGTLTAAATVIEGAVYGEATLSGTGSLAAKGSYVRFATATLTGTGSLSAQGSYLRLAAATLSGTGSLSAAGTVIGPAIYGSATLSGAGSLTASAVAILIGQATLAGEGSLSAQGKCTLTATATLSGTGALSAQGKCTFTATATLSGVGSLSAAGQTFGLEASLLAAQKKAHRLPYVEAKVYDYEQGIKRLSWSRLYDGSTPWRTPTGYNDPEDAWTDEEKAYDDTDSTHATKQGLVTGQWTPFLELTHDALLCDKVRFLLNNSDFDLVDVDVYYDSAWHDVYQGSYDAYPTWNEKNIPAGLKSVTKARLRARATLTAEDHGCWFHELDFGVPVGLEPDNHHGIAFDGQGSMHRIRAAAGNKLYYQKVTSPDAESDYSQWTELASNCEGPCAIAAYGAKVYIFYKHNELNQLNKLYSHDYGQTWDNAQLIAVANVLSMAASWKGTTSTVVCFAATSIKISAMVLDTATQDTAEHYYNHALDTTYGIGATYRGSEFPIILAAKDTDSGTEIVTYSLYATRLSAAYNFGALRVLLSAQDDVSTVFRYPDCHLPTVAPGEGGPAHEALQLTAAESYSGVTAYDRPLLAHLVKDTDWSSAVITEPKFFLDISSNYGLRLASTNSTNSTNPSWWLSRPDGVWRAPRPAEPPLDLTPYLHELRQVIHPAAPGSLTLELDNSKGQFAAPGTGALASLQKRSEVVLRLGYKTPEGNLALPAGTYWIDGWEYRSHVNTSVFVLRCVDFWGLASAWSARYSLRWNYTAFQPCRVWEILYQLLGRFGIRLWNNPEVPQSVDMNNYYPKFLSRGGTNAATQLRRLLDFVTDGLVPREALCFAKDLLATEPPVYEYKNQPGFHTILQGAYPDNLTTTHTQVSGDTEDEPPVHVREAAFDWPLLSLGIDNLAMQYDPNLEEPDQAQKRADALLRHVTLSAAKGLILIPTNVAQVLYDVVKITDTRVGLADKNFRVLAIQTDYSRRQGIYTQRLVLCAP